MQQREHEFNWEVRDLAKIAFKRWWVPVPVTALCLALVFAVLAFWTPVYTASVRLLVSGTPKTDSPLYTAVPAGRMMSIALAHAEMLKSQDILRDVVLDLGLQDRKDEMFFSTPKKWAFKAFDASMDLYDRAYQRAAAFVLGTPPEPARRKDPVMKAVESLEKRIVTEAIDKTDVLTLTVKDYDPDTAAKIGNLMALRYTVFVMKQQAADLAAQYGPKHPLTLQLKEDIARQEANIKKGEPALALTSGVGTIKIVQTAHVPTKPSQPKRRPMLLVGLGGGILGGILLMFFLERIDPTFQGLESLRRGLPFPIIGTVPRKLWVKSGLLKDRMKKAPDLEPFMALAFQIDTLRQRSNAKIICLSSTEETRTTARLAQVLALCLSRIHEARKPGQSGSVLLVEAQPTGSHFLHQPLEAKGTALSVMQSMERGAESDAAFQRVDDHLSLAVLDHDHKGASAIALGESKYRAFLKDAVEKFDTVLIHGEAYARRHGSLMVNTLCDSTIVVINEERTRKKALEGLLHMLEINHVKVLGAILNDQRHHLPGPLYRIF